MCSHGYMTRETYKCKTVDFMFLSYFNKIPQTGWLKQINLFLTDLKAGNMGTLGTNMVGFW